MPIGLGVVLGLGVVAAVVLAYLVWVLASNRRVGARGLSRRVRLTCPKCGGSFEYRFVPGASATSLRLGTGRYMACPLCHRWSVFRLSGVPEISPAEPDPPSAPRPP